MPNAERASNNAKGKKQQQQNPVNDENKIRAKIVELKSKIMMNEKLRASIKKKNEAEIAWNEKEISELRFGNTHTRIAVRKALDVNECLLSAVFANSKSKRLALSQKSGEVAVKETDLAVCELKRKFNSVSFSRKKRQEKLDQLQKEYYLLTQAPGVHPEISSEARQLQNSITKVSIKKSSALHVQGLYVKILRALQGELRKYPNLLDDLEEQISAQRTDLQSLQEMQHNAFEERDVAQHGKVNFESFVREERRQREAAIRGMRNRVKEVAAEKDLPQTRGKQTRHVIDEQNLAEMARRTQERLDKIKTYQLKANMLEVVTGISFSNKESLINCLENQKNSSTLLQEQSKTKRLMIQKKKKTLEQYEAVYQTLIHKCEKRKNQKIYTLSEKSEQAVATKDSLSAANAKASGLVLQIYSWLRPITTRLLKSCENLKIKNIDALIWKGNQYLYRSNEDLEVEKLFVVFSDLICDLSEQRNVKAKDSLGDVSRKEEEALEEEALVTNNNNRVLHSMEREISEDFDYNTPNNEEYISRAVIKRRNQAENGQQGTRYEKI